jgi:glycerol-3-phosphate dehydrogenase
MNRTEHLRRLSSGQRFDILVIGGGATGLGIAVDAAARGYTVALTERTDFSAGTSSHSTKLVHGGVRYLKQGNIGLVRDALRERGRLHRNAPHIVHDLEFVIPIYRWADFAMYSVGLKFYDQLAGKLSFGRSIILSRSETLDRLPNVAPRGLLGGVLYHDGQFDDARLAITLARTASALGATLVNHCPALALRMEQGKVTGARIRDVESDHEFDVSARCVVNATGVFVDSIRRMEHPGTAPLVAVSQGIHLVLPARFNPGRVALMVPKTDDGRVLFAVPWLDRVIVGTTDTPRPAPEDEPLALDEECDFVLTHARRYLREGPAPSDILSVFAGLRPLVRRANARNTAQLARDHTIEVGSGGLVTITGGKWTTYRQMAEDAVDVAARQAGLPLRHSRTAELALTGATAAPAPPDHPHLGVHGADAPHLLTGTATRLHPRLPYLEAEVRWAAQQEMARTVEDVLARRTRALVLDAAAAAECAPRVATLLAAELGRDPAWIAAQTEAFCHRARMHQFAASPDVLGSARACA